MPMLEINKNRLKWCTGILTLTGCLLLGSGASYTTMIRLVCNYGLPYLLCGVLVTYWGSKLSACFNNHRKHAGYPGPERENFFTGNYYTMKKSQENNKLFDLLMEWTLKHGKTFVFWRFDHPKWFTVDPDIIKSMLTDLSVFKKATAIPNRTLFNQRITGTSSFLTVKGGEMWAKKRKVMSSYFTKIHMASMFDSCKDSILKGTRKQLEESVSSQTPVNLVEFYGEIFQYFLGALGFDLDCELVTSNTKFHNLCIQRILKWVPLQLQTPIETWKMKRNPEVIETLEMVKKLRQIAGHILDFKHKELGKDGHANENDIIHMVINANKDDNEEPSRVRDFELDDVMTIFLVIDNMAKTLATFFVEVIRNHDVYEKVSREVRAADISSLHTMDTSLPYTEMAILETLRLHPTLMRGIRIVGKNLTLKDLTITAKSMIFFGQLVLHKHPDFWESPEEFTPERFANGTGFIEPFTYLPFVAGPRVCMGKHLAMLTMKLAIVATLKNYDMRPVPGQEKDKEWDLRFTIVRPIKGHLVDLFEVKDSSEISHNF